MLVLSFNISIIVNIKYIYIYIALVGQFNAFSGINDVKIMVFYHPGRDEISYNVLSPRVAGQNSVHTVVY